MRNKELYIVIEHFDGFCKNIDFKHLPEHNSEEYRKFVLKTANDVIFSQGRYSVITEWTLELFDIPEVNEQICDLAAINALTADERTRLGFYLALKDVCYPLFKGMEVDWTAWPWNMNDADSSLDNQELMDFVSECEWPCLAAAIIYDLQNRVWREDKLFSSVARQEASEIFERRVKPLWEKSTKTDEDKKELASAVNKAANDLWFIKNHMLVGRQLGFDYTAQSVYDAVDTFIDTTYRHKQVDFARELGAWINQHMTVGDRHPEQALVDALHATMKGLMEKYDVSSPDLRYTWNIITLDLLGMSMFSEDEETADDDSWLEDE